MYGYTCSMRNVGLPHVPCVSESTASKVQYAEEAKVFIYLSLLLQGKDQIIKVV